MAQRKLSFKEVVNEAILRGLAADRRPHEFHTKTHSMGRPRVNLDKATQVAGELDTQDFLRKMTFRSVKLADSNVLIYAVHQEAKHHRAALAWLDGALLRARR